MNLHPVVGDRWTKPGSPDLTLEITGVDANTVTLRYKVNTKTTDIPHYLRMAQASLDKGHILHRNQETEDCIFE